MKKILDKLAYGPTVFFGAIFFLMPFFPEPHFVEKVKIIISGTGMDGRAWFDIVLHTLAGVVAVTKHFRHRKLAALGEVAEGDRDAIPAKSHDQNLDHK